MEVLKEPTPANFRRGFFRNLACRVGAKMCVWGSGGVEAEAKPLRKCAVSSSSSSTDEYNKNCSTPEEYRKLTHQLTRDVLILLNNVDKPTIECVLSYVNTELDGGKVNLDKGIERAVGYLGNLEITEP